MTTPINRRWIIAEVGSVHDGSFGNACKLIELAAECGANVVKFQTHVAEAETLANAPAPSYFKAEPRLDYFKRTAFSLAQWQQLATLSKSRGMVFMSSPFAIEAVALLEQVGLDVYKIASGEVTNLPMLEAVAATGKPVILSSGMSDWSELDRAVEILRKNELIVMQCTSAYPCPIERAGANVVTEIAARYGTETGFSDHTNGVASAITAIWLGATAIEKHITFSRAMYGSDAQFGVEPPEFRRYCQEMQDAWTLRENPVDKSDLGKLREMKSVFEKSIVTAGTIAKGDVLTRERLAFKKPGTGIRADQLDSVLGKRATRDLPTEHLLATEDFQ